MAFITISLSVGVATGQALKISKKTSGSRLELRSFESIPEPLDVCSSTEREWWNRLSKAGNKLLTKGDPRSKRIFVTIFTEGIENNYCVPVGDRPFQALSAPPPSPLPAGIKPKNGKVKLSVNVRADGSLGDIKVLESLRSDMDEQCMAIKRQTIFLPAVDDHKFIESRRVVGCESRFKNSIHK